MTLLPHQQRVKEEYADLNIKLEKLVEFICSDQFKTVDLAEQGRLMIQSGIMNNYIEILRQRIAAFDQC